MTYFNKRNTIFGWAAFLVAAIVYLITMEPSASLWDCSEFIATSYKLEVGHPPGAPLFMMIARFFTIFAPDTANVAMMVNTMSALASAFTILFLFWTITHFGRRLTARRGHELTKAQTWTIIGAGLIGSLSYAFTDTFWFSAVEAEVYALSSLFTAIVVWAMLKWEDAADKPHANRWLILIAYLMGLSIGVHILNLLAIPAIVFIYYFKKTDRVTFKGVVKVSLVAAAILLFIHSIVITYTTAAGAAIDRLFVNSFGLPVNSGMVVFAILLLAALAFAVYITHRKGFVVWNTIALCITVIMIGYSSYASVVIRAAANPPMNSNDPDNPYGLLYLLNREQYGTQPILYGPQYPAPIEDLIYDTKYYIGDDGKYHEGYSVSGYKYPSEFMTLFPRMWSDREQHVAGYKEWGKVKEENKVTYRGKRYAMPTTGENLRYFFSYQVNFMYRRYFLWNFVGRQSDGQSIGGITDGQWMSGIDFIDEAYLGPQDNLPDEMADNKGRNHYYFLPFILGIIGLIYHLNRDPKNFTVAMWLFIMMGIALVVYFNSAPGEVRERDYVYAGSFYAFCIWIGLGVMCIKDWIQKLMKKESVVAAVAATAVCATVPVILCAQNWDDHDRSHRYVSRDLGWNYLQSCLPNSIIMNYGDNDSFPLWYAQEVEEVRLDVRIMNMSYMLGGWYIDEMKYKSNESDPVPFSLPRSKYMYTNEMVPVEDLFDVPVTAKQVINFVKDDDPRSRVEYFEKTVMDYIPAKKILLPVNKQNAIECGIVKPEDAHLMVDTIDINIKGSSLERADLMLLDLLANFDWKRPLYVTSPSQLTNLGLEEYLQFDGYAYRFVPIKTPYTNPYEIGRIDTDYLYNNLMEMFRYGNVSDPRVYIDPTIDHTFGATCVRVAFARLATALAEKGETEKAEKVLDYAMEQIPAGKFRWSFQDLTLIQAYYGAGAYEKGDKLLKDYFTSTSQYIEHYLSFPESKIDLVVTDLESHIYQMNRLHRIAEDTGRTDLSDSLAMKALEYGLEVYEKDNYVFHEFYHYITFISAYYENGDTEKGDEMLDTYTAIFMSEINYLNNIRKLEPEIAEHYIKESTMLMGELLRIAELHGRTDTASEIKAFFGIE